MRLNAMLEFFSPNLQMLIIRFLQNKGAYDPGAESYYFKVANKGITIKYNDEIYELKGDKK